MDTNPYRKGTVPWYEFEYQRMTFDPGCEHQIEKAAQRLVDNRDRYLAMTKVTNVPWRLIGSINNMECGGDFRCYLGNGERIIGTDRKSVLVPSGRGPFATWEAGAFDALKLDGLLQIGQWTLGLELRYAEIFNGTGYLKYHPTENSPYIWASTSVNDGFGKYVSDGKYDEMAPTNKQVGVAAIYKQIELWGKV